MCWCCQACSAGAPWPAPETAVTVLPCASMCVLSRMFCESHVTVGCLLDIKSVYCLFFVLSLAGAVASLLSSCDAKCSSPCGLAVTSLCVQCRPLCVRRHADLARLRRVLQVALLTTLTGPFVQLCCSTVPGTGTFEHGSTLLITKRL